VGAHSHRTEGSCQATVACRGCCACLSSQISRTLLNQFVIRSAIVCIERSPASSLANSRNPTLRIQAWSTSVFPGLPRPELLQSSLATTASRRILLSRLSILPWNPSGLRKRPRSPSPALPHEHEYDTEPTGTSLTRRALSHGVCRAALGGLVSHCFRMGWCDRSRVRREAVRLSDCQTVRQLFGRSSTTVTGRSWSENSRVASQACQAGGCKILIRSEID
jgi:hypothetical protein